MDKFPEAFRRFEKVVDVDSFESYRDLRYAFTHWANKRWRNTYSQNRALVIEGRDLGFKDTFMPSFLGETVKEEKRIKAYRRARVRREKWAATYRKKVKKQVKVVAKKYRGIGEVRVKALSWYVNRGYSANKIQKRLSERGIGIQRKKLLKIVREMRLREKKANPEKYNPYRGKKRGKKR